MSPPPTPDHDDAAVPTGVASLALDDGGFVVYDPDREDAWLQSDAPAVLTEWQ